MLRSYLYNLKVFITKFKSFESQKYMRSYLKVDFFLEMEKQIFFLKLEYIREKKKSFSKKL